MNPDPLDVIDWRELPVNPHDNAKRDEPEDSGMVIVYMALGIAVGLIAAIVIVLVASR